MRPLTLLFCVWVLLSPALWATPADEENTGKPPHDIVVEVDRYIVWPSQALGYKIGQLKIRQLRTHTEKELGANFDLRAFHDEVLKNGALPLSVLETHIHEWVAKRKGA